MSAPRAVICSNPERLTEARELAQRFHLPLLDAEQGLLFSGLALKVEESLALQDVRLGTPLRVDFEDPALLRRLDVGRRQPLARACGLHRDRNPSILDCTTGLGQDLLTLAALGARVTPLERNAFVYLLLSEAFARNVSNEKLSNALKRCEPPINRDALDFLRSTAGSRSWDVIYMDPMYSGYRRRALPGKSMQLLAELCGPDEDADELLILALKKAGRRVVVKRGPRAPLLASREPHHQVKGGRMRFDVYLVTPEQSPRVHP